MPSKAKGLKESLELLERVVAKAYGDLPRGFTWREALARLRVDLDEASWAKLRALIETYEAARYGGEEQSLDASLVLNAVRKLGPRVLRHVK